MAEAMIKPATIKTDWRFRRRMFSLASRHTTKRWGMKNGWIKVRERIPTRMPPMTAFTGLKPNQDNT